MQFSENFSSELLALFRMTLVHVENHSSHCVDSEDSKHGRRAYDHVIMHRSWSQVVSLANFGLQASQFANQ